MRYKELMNTIRVTPEMRAHILSRMEKSRAERLRRRRMRRIYTCAASLAACVVLALALGSFAGRMPEKTDEPMTMGAYSVMECASIDELSRALGFAVRAPSELPFEPEQTTYNNMFGKFAQIDYRAGDASLCVRMAPGTEDISGDYNAYAKEETVELDGQSVLLKGDGSAVSLATWTDGEYAYSISAEPAVSREEMLRMAESAQ